jgi:hypothetical protein
MMNSRQQQCGLLNRHTSFTLYNVSGLDAVELKLKSGEVRRIGTDNPQGLAAALQQRCSAPKAFSKSRSAKMRRVRQGRSDG